MVLALLRFCFFSPNFIAVNIAKVTMPMSYAVNGFAYVSIGLVADVEPRCITTL